MQRMVVVAVQKEMKVDVEVILVARHEPPSQHVGVFFAADLDIRFALDRFISHAACGGEQQPRVHVGLQSGDDR